MSKYFSLNGNVVWNNVIVPDEFMGKTQYKLTISLDEESHKKALERKLDMTEYEGQHQIEMKRNFDYGPPLVYNADKEVVGVDHLSKFGDKVTVQVCQGNKEQNKGKIYLEKIRVEEKATGLENTYDPADF